MSKRRGRGKDEGSQPPPPPSVLQGSLFPAVSFPKPCGGGGAACVSLGASPRGWPWAPAGVRPGRGAARSARAVLLVPHPFFFSGFGLPSAVLLAPTAPGGPPLAFCFSCLFTHGWVTGCGLSPGGCRSELRFGFRVETEWGGPLGTRPGGSFRCFPTGERSREIHSSGKQISVAGAAISLQGGGSRKMEWERVLMVRARYNKWFLRLSLSAGGGARCECCCLLSLAPSFSSPSSANREKSAWIIRNTTLKSRGCPSNWTGASSDLQAG